MRGNEVIQLCAFAEKGCVKIRLKLTESHCQDKIVVLSPTVRTRLWC